MKADDRDGGPAVGSPARNHALRPEVDKPRDEDGMVEPGTGGASVSPPPLTNLHPLRLPREFGGLGNDAVFEVETDDLPEDLRYRRDPDNPDGHGFIEPSRRTTFEEYERAVRGTRGLWRLVR